MNIVPLIKRDLSQEVRFDRLHRGRVYAVFVMLALMGAWIFFDWWLGSSSLRRVTPFIPISSIAALLLLVLGLGRGGNLLAYERREGTLPLLLLTHVTGLDIVFGKLLAEIVRQISVFLTTVPLLLLVLILAGFQLTEASMTAVALLNVSFFGIAVGLFGSVFASKRVVEICFLMLVLPLLIPARLARLAPAIANVDWLSPLQWINPCHAVVQLEAALNGSPINVFWRSLLISHVLGWVVLVCAGVVLPWSCRREAGRNAGHVLKKGWLWWRGRANERNAHWRRRVLNRNPFLWLASRDRWPTAQIWLWLSFSLLGWGYLAWVGRGIGMPVYFGTALAAALALVMTLATMTPAEACKRLVEDRQSGALELMFSTPIAITEIVRGQWLALARRYGPPLLSVIVVNAALMFAGYWTFGFGGMLEASDRGAWVLAWVLSFLLLPASVMAVSAVAMRRALVARNPGDAAGVAILQVLLLPGVCLGALYSFVESYLWRPTWWQAQLGLAAMFFLVLAAFSWRATKVLLMELRGAAIARQHEIAPKGLPLFRWPLSVNRKAIEREAIARSAARPASY